MRCKKTLCFNKYPYHFFLCLGVLLFSTHIANAQIRREFWNVLQSGNTTDSIQNAANNIIEREKGVANDSLHYLYHMYAYWYSGEKNQNQAILFENKALEFTISHAPENIKFAQNCAISLAYYYVLNKQFHKSIDAYKKVIKLDNTNQRAITAYLKLGYSYHKVQDYYNAVKYYELGAQLLKKSDGNKSLLLEAYQNLAGTYLALKTSSGIKKGKYYGKLADSLIPFVNISTENRYRIKYSLAQLHNRAGSVDFDTSLQYYNEAKEIALADNDTTKLITVYLGYGVLYKYKNTNISNSYLNKGLKLVRKKDSVRTYQLYTSLGYNSDKESAFEKAHNYRHLALKTLTGQSFIDVKANYDSLFLATKHKEHLLHAIPRLGESYLKHYEAQEHKELLNKSIAYFLMADAIIDLLKTNSSEYRSRLFWRRISTNLYSKAIRACFLQNDTSLAFYFMEKNKALLLLEDISKQRFQNSLSLPQDYLVKKEAIEKNLLQFKKKQQQSDALNEHQESFKKKIIDLEIELEQMKDRADIKDNHVFKMPNIISLEDIQKNIQPNTLFLEYNISKDDGYGIYTNNDNGYVIAITKDSTWFYEISELPSLENNLRDYLSLCRKPFENNADRIEYENLSKKIFTTLFPSEAIQSEILNKSITIVPDNYLSFLPFETLLVPTLEEKYLIEKSKINYQYSYSFIEHVELNNIEKTQFIAFSPENFEALGLEKLNYSTIELSSLEENYKGTIFNDTLATKRKFLETLSNASILHLTTHADAQDSIAPWIAFNDEKLVLDDLYVTKNKASLVFLSGCNTTMGKHETGEGVMSLARGFFYGGAQSVISSLWSVDDKSTATLSNDFYTYLAEGKTKSEALHMAKLTYLKKHSLSERSPYYWGSLILLGNDDTILPTTKYWPYVVTILGGLLLFILIFYFFRKKMHQKG